MPQIRNGHFPSHMEKDRKKNCTGGFTHKGVNTEYANYAFELGFSRNITTLVDQIH